MFFDEYRDMKLNSTVLTFIHPGWYLNFSAWFIKKNVQSEQEKIKV
jgi:hypothetical protein